MGLYKYRYAQCVVYLLHICMHEIVLNVCLYLVFGLIFVVVCAVILFNTLSLHHGTIWQVLWWRRHVFVSHIINVNRICICILDIHIIHDGLTLTHTHTWQSYTFWIFQASAKKKKFRHRTNICRYTSPYSYCQGRYLFFFFFLGFREFKRLSNMNFYFTL